MWILDDIRYACRSLLRMPLVAAVVVLSVAAGVGINTVVFSWVQARFLDPIPGVADGSEVRLIEPRSEAGLYVGTSWPEYLDLRERLQSFSGLFAGRMAPLYVGEPGAVERVFGMLASANYFSALGVQPAIGRFFTPDEGEPAGTVLVAVISDRLWRTRFDGSRAVLGQTARINGQELTVIGVTPPVFQGTHVGLQFDVWVPATLAPRLVDPSGQLENRRSRGYGVMGRLRPGSTEAQAQQELELVMRQLAKAYPAASSGVTAEILAFHEPPRGPQRMLNAAVLVLQALMLLLLLAVCGNVANLLLARASARQREMAIRLSLGAPPRRIASLLLTESVLLALAGAALDAALAIWGTRALLILPSTGLPLRFETRIDGTGLAFAMGLGVLSGLLFGAAPALVLARVDPHAALRAGATSAGRSALRHTLMGAQVALALIVLLAAGTFFRAFVEARRSDPGFRRDNVTLAAYDLSGRAVDGPFTRDLARRALERLRELPFVRSVAIASAVPLDIHGLPSRPFTVEGQARADGRADEALTNVVTPGYFEVMGIPMLAGRDFADLADASAPRQVIVNQAFVQRYVPGGEALGRRLETRGATYTIVAVVATSLANAFGEAPTPVIYFSYRDLPQPQGEIHVHVRDGAPAAARAALARAMRDVDAELPVFNLRSMTRHVDTNLVFRKIPAQMFSVLGPMLLVLAAMGIYAVVSYDVSLRTREVGVRMALGATGRRVVRTFLAERLTVAASGALIGWALAFALGKVLAPGGRLDAGVFVVVPVILLGVAALACWLPARRAAAVDPATALRAE